MFATSVNSTPSSSPCLRAKRKHSCDDAAGAMSPSSMEEAAFPSKKTKMNSQSDYEYTCKEAPPSDDGPQGPMRECVDHPLHESTPLRDPQQSLPPMELSEDNSTKDSVGNLNSPPPYDPSACADYGPAYSPRSPQFDDAVGSAGHDGPYYGDYDAAAYYDYADDSDRRRRTLQLEYWTRSDECKERKWDHLDLLDSEAHGMTREEHIFATTLAGRTSYMEPNMFPYETPAGIEHWTLWSRNELDHAAVQDYVEGWITANAPHVTAWNYDDNPERSIDIFHVHVYLQVEEADVLQGRRVEDLVH